MSDALFSFTEKSFLPAAQAGMFLRPPFLYTAFCTPLFFFSLRKKKKSAVHGVEEKEGPLLSVCAACPVGAENLS